MPQTNPPHVWWLCRPVHVRRALLPCCPYPARIPCESWSLILCCSNCGCFRKRSGWRRWWTIGGLPNVAGRHRLVPDLMHLELAACCWKTCGPLGGSSPSRGDFSPSVGSMGCVVLLLEHYTIAWLTSSAHGTLSIPLSGLSLLDSMQIVALRGHLPTDLIRLDFLHRLINLPCNIPNTTGSFLAAIHMFYVSFYACCRGPLLS